MNERNFNFDIEQILEYLREEKYSNIYDLNTEEFMDVLSKFYPHEIDIVKMEEFLTQEEMEIQ